MGFLQILGADRRVIPITDRFVGHHDAMDQQQLFDIPVAQAEPKRHYVGIN